MKLNDVVSGQPATEQTERKFYFYFMAFNVFFISFICKD